MCSVESSYAELMRGIRRLSSEVISLFKHGIGGGDDLGVEFVCSLGCDHVDHLIGNVNIRSFEVSLHNFALIEVIVGGLVEGLAAGCGLAVKAVALSL